MIPAKGEKLELLERTVLELGAEIFRIKTEMSDMKTHHAKFVETMKGLKELLDEKGMIHAEDFDAAVDLGTAISLDKPQHDPSFDAELEKLKKTSH